MFKVNLRLRLRQLRFAMVKYRQGGGRTLLCNNCTGAMVLHDFGLRFDTPTVNLYIPPSDFIEMMSNLEYYMTADMKDITNGNPYPVGLLANRVRLNFVHFNTYKEAKDAWERRKRRVDYDNIYCVLVERDGCTYDDLEKFDALPYENKVALVHKQYPQIKCAFVIDAPDENGQLPQILSYYTFWGSRYYDQFNWRRFLHLR